MPSSVPKDIPFFEIRRIHAECYKVYVGGVFLMACASEYKARGQVHQIQAAFRKYLRRMLSTEIPVTEEHHGN